MRPKIFITGGHLTPALAVIQEIEHQGLQWDLVFVGRKHAVEGSRTVSAEYTEVGKLGIKFLALTTARLHRDNPLKVLLSLIRLPIGFAQSFSYILSERPALVMSFGGYIALPVALTARICGIPVVTHEQTTVPGLANTWIGWVAKRVCLTFPDTAGHFAREKEVITGLPLRKGIFSKPTKPAFIADMKKPILYITGGSTGAVSVNNLLFPIIAMLAQTYTIVHQTGPESFVQAKMVKQTLPIPLQKQYLVGEYFGEQEASWLLQHAALVVGRSGANTVVELATLGKMALLIPLPWSGGGEQQKNAEWLAAHGGGCVLLQDEATSAVLQDMITMMMQKRDMYEKAASMLARQMPHDAAKLIVEQLSLLLPQ